MTNFDDIAQRLKYHDEFDHGAGADPHLIAAAEQQLGRAFPESYRQFLRAFGWGCLGNFEIYGLGKDVPEWLDVTKVSANGANGTHAPLPAHLFALHHDGDGDHICIDTRQRAGDAVAVVFWDNERGHAQHPEKIADDFSDWVASLL